MENKRFPKSNKESSTPDFANPMSDEIGGYDNPKPVNARNSPEDIGNSFTEEKEETLNN